MTQPVLPWHVYEGAHYWAAWGNKGWTAVTVVAVKRKWAQVTRVDPKTNKPKNRNSKVRLDELVKRDPKKKGKDKPQEGPAAVFAGARASREQEAVDKTGTDGLSTETKTKRNSSNSKHIEWTDEERNEFFRSTFDAVFGEGWYDSAPTTDDW